MKTYNLHLLFFLFLLPFCLSAQTTITLSSGTLTIVDSSNKDDALTLSIDGTNLRISDPNNTLTVSGTGVTAVNSNTIDVPLANITGNIVVDTKTGTDTLNLDANLNLTGTQGIEVRGATTINQNAVITYVNGAIDYQASDNITFNNGAALMGSVTGTGEVLLLSEGNIVINGAIQNAAEMNGGAINLVAGWDGTTAFSDAFGAVDVNAATATLFGNNAGSVFIGDGTQTSGVAVGSRSGATRVYGHDLNILAGTGADGRYAQLGFQATDQGDTYPITGALSARVRSDIVATGGAATNSHNYAQLGHVGADQSADTMDEASVTNAATISIAAGNDLRFTGGGRLAYSQLGHGGYRAHGDTGGAITISTANDLLFSGGNYNAYSQLGHGGVLAHGDHSGDIMIGTANDLTFSGGGTLAYSQLGHGSGNFGSGSQAAGTRQGAIAVTATGEISIADGNTSIINYNYSWIGHGSRGISDGAGGVTTANPYSNADVTIRAAAIDYTALATVTAGGIGVVRGDLITSNLRGGDVLVQVTNSSLAAGPGSLFSTIDTPNTLTLMASHNLLLNHSIQNAAEMNGGAINLVAGWDGTTAFDPTTFDAFDTDAELSGTTPFGNNSGSVTIGDGNQASGVAVGSRSGATRAYGHNLNIWAGTGGDGRYAQLGFQASDQTASYNITGVLSARVRNDIVATGGATSDNNYAQLGHAGADQMPDTDIEATIDAAISVAAGNNLTFTGGGGNAAYSQLGQGGFNADGDHSGTIVISSANDLIFRGGGGINSYSQLGHGGALPSGNHGDDITITTVNDLSFTGGGLRAYSQLGHGGYFANGNHSGAITIMTANDLSFTGDGDSAYSQLGHGGISANGNHSGAIAISTANDLTFKGGGTLAYSQLGHGGALANGNHSGAITISTANDLSFSGGNTNAYSQLGHGGALANGNHSGAITISTANDLSVSGGSAFSYSQLGHGAADFGFTNRATGTRQGDISVTATGEISLIDGANPNISHNYGWIGHDNQDTAAGTCSNADVTIRAAAIDNTAMEVVSGGQGIVASDWLFNSLKGGAVSLKVTDTGVNLNAPTSILGTVSSTHQLVVDVANDLVLNSGFAFTQGGMGNLIFAAGEDFHNDSGSTTPLTTGGRWLVYSTTPDNNRQDLEITNYDFIRYDINFNPLMPNLTGLLPSGHGLLYVNSPEIEISSSESGALTDGGTDAQGDEASSIRKTVTYTVTNSGTAPLTLSGIASVTNLVNISGTPTVTSTSLSASGSTSLSALASTTFEVTYIPDCGSNFSFDVSIAHNDADENPFNFTVSGTASDATAPLAPSLATVTEQCNASVSTPTATDNCSGVISGTTSDSTTFSSQGIHTIRWIFTDAVGNSSTATQTIIIRDTTPPVAPILPEILSEETISLTPPTTTDNCSGNVIGTTSSPLTYSDSGSYVVTWTFTDGVGNRSIALQKIRIERSGGGGGTPPPSPEEDPCDKDTLAPVVPSILPINDSCRISLDIPTAEDNCSGTVTGVTTASLIYEQVGSYTVTWTFTDTAGNSSTAVQLITILYDQEVIDTQEACASFTWIDGVVYTESNNTATFETTDAQGCTSLHRLDLTINPLPDATVTLDNNILSAVHTGAQYQWIDCENGNTPIAGATQQSFAPTGVKGSYAVQITTAEGCTLTSDCIPYFDTTTLLVAEGISPNGDGVNDTWVIQGIEFHPNAQIYVYNRSGEVVFSTLNGYNNDWRGDWNETGRTLPSAPYFYTLDRNADGKIDDYGWIYIQN